MGCCCVQNLRDIEDMEENLTDSRIKLAQNS